MKKRIFSNWRTSLIGVCLLITSIVLVILRIITFAEFAAFFPTILGLIYVQDSVLKLNPSKVDKKINYGQSSAAPLT